MVLTPVSDLFHVNGACYRSHPPAAQRRVAPAFNRQSDPVGSASANCSTSGHNLPAAAALRQPPARVTSDFGRNSQRTSIRRLLRETNENFGRICYPMAVDFPRGPPRVGSTSPISSLPAEISSLIASQRMPQPLSVKFSRCSIDAWNSRGNHEGGILIVQTSSSATHML